MPEFKCVTCGERFSVSEHIISQYPGWTPRYCKVHRKKKAENAKNKMGDESALSSLGPFEIAGSNQMEVISSFEKDPGLSNRLAETLLKYNKGPISGVFTDGGARPNPGRGGWGLVHVENNLIIHQKRGIAEVTTNNIMELTALIEAYKYLPLDSSLVIYSDSDLCVKTVSLWAEQWEKRGWKRKGGEIKNLELVRELYALAKSHPKVELKWIKAHNGWRWNEYVDVLATGWLEE